MEYRVGMLVELVYKANVYSFSPNEKINLGLTPELLKKRKLVHIRPGFVGTIEAIDNDCIQIKWETNVSTCIIPRIDTIREVKMPVRVYRPRHSLYMDDWELAQWANMVHKNAGGNGEPFTPDMMKTRLVGYHCDCGVDKMGYTKGKFELLPFISEEVWSGGKAYMVCKHCGCMSHL